MIADLRNYYVKNTEQAKEIAAVFLREKIDPDLEYQFGLPEVHDRYHVWNVPVKYNQDLIGTISIDAFTGKVNASLSSNITTIKKRISTPKTNEKKHETKKRKKDYVISDLGNMILKGRAECALSTLPDESIDMIFTSPPYYNARKQYSEYATYDDYLKLIRSVIRECARVLIDGKFFIMNSSHVLVPRASRNESSTRIPVPFDIHQIFMEEGFEFVDDIIWQKPEGAGWASGRGRRFSADRNPMQYKAVPVTEYVMVYRKKPTILIDYYIRNHPDQDIIARSKIEDGYEKTNVWYISPARDKRHPAIFPKELAEKVIKYYSFENDIVLDPFGGIGTTARAAFENNRRFVTIECDEKYVEATINDLNRLNTIVKPLDYDVVDCTASPSKLIEDDINSMIKKLHNNGIKDDEILEVLNSLCKGDEE